MIKNRLGPYLVFIGLIIFSVFFFNACEVEEPKLSQKNKIVADSLIGIQTRLVADEVDSLCQLVYQSTYDRAVDSISAVRLKEIEKYIPSK